MSRAINLALPENSVRDQCGDHGVLISAIEPLPSGGTHLVCMTGEGTAKIRHSLAAHIIVGNVRRFAFYRG